MPPSAGTALIYSRSANPMATTFAGRSLLDRAEAVARASGLRPVRVASVAPDEDRHGAVRPGDPLPAPDGPVIVLRDDVACVAGALRDLLRSSATLVVRDDAGQIALVRSTVAELGGRVPASPEEAARGIPLAPHGGRLGERAVQALRYALSGRPQREILPEQRAAEREFLRALENPRDGYFDRVLNRRLSRPITLRLLPLPVTPNQITVVALLLSFVGAACIALPGVAGPVLGALLLQFTAVLDCVDGEIARAKVLETEWGEWLDITSDTLIHVATFLGIAVHAWPDLGRTTAWTLGALFTVGGLASFVVVTRAEKTEDTWKRSGDWRARLLALLLATLTTRDLSVLVLVAAATDLLTPLLVGAALGAQVFWCGTLALHASLMRRVA